MMRKMLITICLACAAIAAGAQDAYIRPKLGSNWAVGLNVGAATPVKGHAFFPNMRPTVGLNLDKHLTPAFAVGIEGIAGFNTSSWPMSVHSATAVDKLYAGVYGSLDFLSISGLPCARRPFAFGIQAGAGWGHDFRTGVFKDHNFFATKAGLFLRYNLSERFALSLSPSVLWDMSDAPTRQSSASYKASKAVFMLQAGLRYNFGSGFECPSLYNAAQIEALNGQTNGLRADLAAAEARASQAEARAGQLAAELREAQTRKPEVVKEVAVNNRLNTVLDVFFLLGSAKVMPDQMPNVERIAVYLKNHPGARVVIKGYASRDGNHDANLRLATRRAESVRDELIKRYGIAPSRISASGAGIGELFEEESWNRVSVCTIEND